MGDALAHAHARGGHVAEVGRGRVAQQAPERGAQHGGVVAGLGQLGGDAAQLRRQRRDAVAVAVLGRQTRRELLGGPPEAAVVEHAREQLVGGLPRLELEQLLLLAGEHEPRLELEQRGDEDQELGGRLQVQLALGLEVVEVGEHDVGEIDLQQVELLAQDERQQEVEGPGEDVEVQLELGDAHRAAG